MAQSTWIKNTPYSGSVWTCADSCGRYVQTFGGPWSTSGSEFYIPGHGVYRGNVLETPIEYFDRKSDPADDLEKSVVVMSGSLVSRVETRDSQTDVLRKVVSYSYSGSLVVNEVESIYDGYGTTPISQRTFRYWYVSGALSYYDTVRNF